MKETEQKNEMQNERLHAARGVEDQIKVLMLFVREGIRDDVVFGDLVRKIAKRAKPLPEYVTVHVLELVRMAKDCVFGQTVRLSLVEAKADEVAKACHRVRLECGEQLPEERQPEHKVKTWGATHAVETAKVPQTWDEMQRSGVLYGDGHHPLPVVVVTGSEVVSPRKQQTLLGEQVQKSGPGPIQSSAPKPDPARERALLEIESVFGEETKFEAVAAKAPSPRQAEPPPLSPRGSSGAASSGQTAQSPRKAVATAARPVVPTQQINAALPQSVGGLRIVK